MRKISSTDGKQVVYVYKRRPSNAGVIPGVFGCVFALLGIFTIAIVFLPLAVFCNAIGLINAASRLSATGIFVSILGGFLTFIGIMASPTLWALLTIGAIMDHADRSRQQTNSDTPAIESQSAPAPIQLNASPPTTPEILPTSPPSIRENADLGLKITPQGSTSQTENRWTGSLSEPLSLNLLNLDEAIRVQERLIELGFFKGPSNGTWGPLSRQALRYFKISNGLSDDDRLDDMTGGRLASPEAVRSPLAQGPTLAPISEAIYPPVNGATLNPLNQADSARINGSLHKLGFYQGKNETLWSGASRAALKAFKIRNGLVPDDTWDGQTERALFEAARK
jgi:hypothetical protein